MPQAYWQVQEDQYGRWRDFPLELLNQIEREWQKWQEKGAADEVVVNYVWPSANMVTHYERVVRRLVDPS